MLVEAFQHRPHRDDLGDDAEQGAAGERQDEAQRHRHAHAQMNSEPRMPPSIPRVPAVKLNTREAENITL